MITAKVICDSLHNNKRLTTLELEYPRYIHSEFMTHRVFSRNASSSRAIPIEKMISRIEDDPIYPIFMYNQKGMAASESIKDSNDLDECYWIWNQARSDAILHARRLVDVGVHKQVVNRLLEPFATIKTIVSATEWDNFFSLRINPAAQQEIQILATAIKEAIDASIPKLLDISHWHLPYIQESEEDLPLETLRKISVARCARVSYLNHDNLVELEKDIELHDQLVSSRHASPFEHVATPNDATSNGNFKGWLQYRFYLGL